MTRVSLKSVFETNKYSFCIQLMIVYVFQHKSDVFRLIDVINGVIFYGKTNLLLSLIYTLQVDTRLSHMRFLSLYKTLVSD